VETLKKQIVRTIAAAMQAEGMEQNKVIILTAGGLIAGTVYSEENFSKTDLSHCLVPGLAEAAVKDYDTSILDGNDGYLPLSDVTIKNGPNNSMKVPSLIVFYDQIIGITLGNFN